MRITNTCGFLSVFLPSLILAQSLDWSGDVTLFGTVENECRPGIAVRPGTSVIHAFCVRSDTVLDCKVSRNSGLAWSDATHLSLPVGGLRIVTSADPDYSYTCVFSERTSLMRLYRFTGSGQDWNSALIGDFGGGLRLIQDVAMISDYRYNREDSYLNLLWSERDSGGGPVRILFAQSRDRGVAFGDPSEIVSFNTIDGGGETGLAVTWSGELETLVAISTVDRPGSIPEGLMLFRSDDQGSSWSSPLLLDSATYRQVNPAIAAYAQIVLIAYARRSGPSEQRDIYFTYSPDGGRNFAPATAIADSIADEHSPGLAISEDGRTFLISYFAGSVVAEDGAILARQGLMATPWMIGDVFMVSAPGGATRDVRTCPASGTDGFAAVWTDRFALGDSDVKFDASWHGLTVMPRMAAFLSGTLVGPAYPNPVNSQVTLPLLLTQPATVSLRMWNAVGRMVMVRELGVLPTGAHDVSLDLSRFSSGVYFIGPVHNQWRARIVVVR